MQPSYRNQCPNCNFVLYPVVLDPKSAPWLCIRDRYSWWAAELSEKARKQFRKATFDFGWGEQLDWLNAEIQDEMKLAEVRGTSCREDMIELVPLAGLQRMESDPGIHLDFKKLVSVERVRKEQH
jgi:hypothetical protein